jgi:mitochondrial GTPase 1
LDNLIQKRNKPRIVVLNKADLAGIGPGPKANRIAAEIKRYSPGVLDVIFTNGTSQNTYRSGIKKVLNAVLDHMPGKFKTTPRVVLIVGAPNVGKSTIINGFRRLFGMRRKGKAIAGGVPGITRSITGFKIHDDPPLILLDSPGVCPPRFNPGDHETPMRMAICGLIKDQILGSKTLADFLLYTLNRNGMFEYMKLGKLLAPSDDIDFVLSMIANKNTRSRDEEIGYVNEHNAGGFLLKHFREGKLGKFMLDRLPSRESKIFKPISHDQKQRHVFEAMQGHYERFEAPRERLQKIFLEQTGYSENFGTDQAPPEKSINKLENEKGQNDTESI